MAAARIGNILVEVGVGLSNLNAGMAKVNATMEAQGRKFDKFINAREKTLKKAGQRAKSKDSIFSGAWFKQRARWFVQLRAFWTLWQQLSKAVRGAFEFEQEMANVRAITQATNAQFELLAEKALEVGKTTRFSAKEAAEGMVVMSQAGLSVTEVLSSIRAVANLATATLTDFKDAATLVVTIMRAWKKEASDAGEITDILATSINKTKLTMAALATGFNFISGLAPQLNITLEETTSLLGILANRGLSASTAATSLRAFMSALLSPTDKFKKVLKEVNLTLRDVDPRFKEMSTILETLRVAGFGASEAFRAFRRRAAAGAAILIGASQEFQDLAGSMHQVGRAAQMAEINLDTVDGQTKQFEDTMVALAAKIMKDVDPALKLLLKGLKEIFKVVTDIISPFAEFVGLAAKHADILATFLSRGVAGMATEAFVKDVREMSDTVKQSGDRIEDATNSWRKLQDAQNEVKQLASDALLAKTSQEAEDFIKKALKVAINVKTITAEQAAEITKLSTVEEQRLEIMKLVNSETLRRRDLLARERAHEVERVKIFKTEIAKVTREEGKKAYQRLLDAREELKLAKEKEKVDKKKGKGGVLPLGLGKVFRDMVDASKGKEIKTVVNATNEYNQAMAELFRIIRAGGPEAAKTLDGMGKEFKELKAAIFEAGTPAEIEAVLKKFRMEKGIAKGVLKQSIKDLQDAAKAARTFESAYKQTNAEIVVDLKGRKALLEISIKLNEEKLKELKLLEATAKVTEEMKKITKTIKVLEAEVIDINAQIADTKADITKNQIKAILQQKEINELELQRLLLLLDQKHVLQLLADLKSEEKAHIEDLKHMLEIATLRGAKDREILASEKSILEVQKISLSKQKKLLEGVEQTKVVKDKIKQLDTEILAKEREITIQQEKQKLATSAIARWKAKFKRESPATIKDVLQQEGGIIDTIMESGTAGLETAMTDITMLFAEQRKEANALEGQLAQLNVEYQKAMSEGNVEKARQIQEQMGQLRNKIDDLRDPIKNLGNSFKQLAITILKELQKVIIKMLVTKMIMSLIGGFGGGGGGLNFAGMGASGIGGGFATGGVMPGGTFKNFRKFARGGVTGGAGMAILGDNASGKELVIPSENIKDDEVSGYSRDKETPINIINVVTEQDIANAMSNTAGQRVIVNTIGADLGRRGPTYRAMKT